MKFLTIETYLWIISGIIFGLCLLYAIIYYFSKFLWYLFGKKTINKNEIEIENTEEENAFGGESEYITDINNEKSENENWENEDEIEDLSEKDNTKAKNKKIIEQIIQDAESFKAKNDLIDYEKKLIEWLSVQPNHLEIMKMLADYYLENSDYKKSLSLCKKILEIEPENDKYIYYSGISYLEQSEYETARYLIEKAVWYRPENPKYILSLAETYYVLADTTKSIEFMKKLIKIRPQNIEYIEIIAKIYREIGDDINYRNSLYNMLEIDPLNVKIKEEIARLNTISE